MKIRLMSTEDEADELIERLRQVLDVIHVSNPYPTRGSDSKLVRVYIEVRL